MIGTKTTHTIEVATPTMIAEINRHTLTDEVTTATKTAQIIATGVTVTIEKTAGHAVRDAQPHDGQRRHPYMMTNFTIYQTGKFS